MAMTAFEIFGVLRLDKSDFEKGLKKAGDEAGSIGSKLGSVGGALGKGITAGLGMTVKAVGLASSAVAGFGITAVRAGSSFDSAMGGVAATMGKTVKDLEGEVGEVDTSFGHFSGTLRDFAVYMGQNTSFSATQAAEALNYMALAGYKTQESMQMLPAVLDMAAAGGMELARASDMITDTQSALGLDFKRTALMVDEFAKAASTGNTSVEQLGDAFLTVGGLVRETNGGFINLADGTEAAVDNVQEMEIALTAMANAGIKGSEAGTHMRNMLLKLSDPTKDGAAALENMGIQVFDLEGNMNSLSVIFSQLNREFDNMSQQEKLSVIGDLFNTRDIASAESLLAAVEGTVVKIGDEIYSVDTAYEKFGDDIYDSTKGFEIIQSSWDSIGESILQADGAASQMSETKLNNLSGDVVKFKSALEAAQITLNDKLSPYLREFVQIGTSGLQDVTAAFQTGGLNGAMDALGNTLSQAVNKVIDLLPTLLSAGGKLLGALGKGISDNLPTIVSAAVQVGVEFSKGLVEALPEFIAGISTIIETLHQSFLENQDTIMEVGRTLLDLIVNGMVNGSFAAGEFIVNIINNIVSFFTENIGSIIEVGVSIITQLVAGMIAGIPDMIRGAADLVVQLVLALTDPANLMQILIVGTNLIVALADGIIEAIPKLLDALPQVISNLVAFLIAAVPQLLMVGIQLLLALINGLIRTIPRLVAALPAIILALVGGLKRGVQQIVEVGRQMVEGLWQGIKGRWDRLVEDVKALGGKLVGGLKDLFGIKSPSRVFAEIGRQLDAGLAKGITDNVGLVDKAMSNLDLSTKVSPSVSMPIIGNLSTNNSEIIALLREIAENRNVTVVLEEDADAMFRVMQRKSRMNKQITGQNAFE